MIIYMHEELFEKMSINLNITNIRQIRNFIEIILPKELTNQINIDQLFVSVSEISRMFRFSTHFGLIKITLDTVKLDKHFVYYLIELLEQIKKLINNKK